MARTVGSWTGAVPRWDEVRALIGMAIKEGLPFEGWSMGCQVAWTNSCLREKLEVHVVGVLIGDPPYIPWVDKELAEVLLVGEKMSPGIAEAIWFRKRGEPEIKFRRVTIEVFEMLREYHGNRVGTKRWDKFVEIVRRHRPEVLNGE